MIIPLPAHLEERQGSFLLTSDTAIVAIGDVVASAENLAIALKQSLDLSVEIISDIKTGCIQILDDPALHSLGEEGYQLEIGTEGVKIASAFAAGRFYGIQSFMQLLADGGSSCTIPAVFIEDRPRFDWRGLMLDTSRHLFSVGEIKRFLDLMAFHKLNVFHWHLVDEQGWRLEIKSYPKLTEIGAWRAESPRAGDPHVGDGIPYGGFYTQAEAREIVAYAQKRFITIVPEIEMPGHASSAIASYPHLGNSDLPNYHPQVQCRWGLMPDTYAPLETTFEFLENVLDEVMEIFPSLYIHVGGDEAPKKPWQQSPAAQEVMQRAGLSDEHELQSWFLARIERVLNSRGRRLIGWDEIQEGGLSPTATMMVWRDWSWAKQALEAGNNVVMTPRTHCYLDYPQAEPAGEPEANSDGLVSLETCCEFDPIPGDVSPEAKGRVLGVQGNLWTEFIRDQDYLDYMTWPRACALAEAGWTPGALRNNGDFRTRLVPHLKKLAARGVKHRPLKVP